VLEGFDWTLRLDEIFPEDGNGEGGNGEDPFNGGNGEDTLEGSVHISIEVLCFLSGNLKTTNYLVAATLIERDGIQKCAPQAGTPTRRKLRSKTTPASLTALIFYSITTMNREYSRLVFSISKSAYVVR